MVRPNLKRTLGISPTTEQSFKKLGCVLAFISSICIERKFDYFICTNKIILVASLVWSGLAWPGVYFIIIHK